MAKKIFCDVCGDEMDYTKVAEYLKSQPVLVNIKGHGGETLKFEVAVRVQPIGVPNGEHVDICGSCRAYLLDRLDVRTEDELESSRTDARAANKV